jgi:hypothetical protein
MNQTVFPDLFVFSTHSYFESGTFHFITGVMKYMPSLFYEVLHFIYNGNYVPYFIFALSSELRDVQKQLSFNIKL